MQNGFSHSVSILFTLILPLPNIYTRNNLMPAFLCFQLVILLFLFLFFFEILFCYILFFLFFSGMKLFKLSTPPCNSLLFIIPLFLLNVISITLFYLSCFCILYSYSRILFVFSSSQKSSKSFYTCWFQLRVD